MSFQYRLALIGLLARNQVLIPFADFFIAIYQAQRILDRQKIFFSAITIFCYRLHNLASELCSEDAGLNRRCLEMTKQEFSETRTRPWLHVVRFVFAYILFVIFSVGLTEEAFVALAPLATPELQSENLTDVNAQFEGMAPSFAFVIAFMPIFFVSLISRLIVGWRRMLDPKHNLLIFSTALMLFMLVFLPPDDWGNYRGTVWVPASRGEQIEYYIWTGLGAFVGFFLPYLRGLFSRKA